jgi:biopolymer transport protein ExbB
LNALRQQVAEETGPLHRKLGELEAELSRVRREHAQATGLRDRRVLDQTNLNAENKAHQEQAAQLSYLLDDYQRKFESGLHVAEIQRYREAIEAARSATDNDNFTEAEVFQAQADLVAQSLDRLVEALGGARFAGSAVDASGAVKQGDFALVGPAAIFRSADGASVGAVEQRLGSSEPSIVPFLDPLDAAAAAELVAASAGAFPLDPTLGNARKVEAAEETPIEHAKKGGPVMVPIVALAGAALLVAVLKWLGMAFILSPSQKRIRALMEAVGANDAKAALQRARSIGGPVGEMLAAGVEHLDEPRELIEEVMYEKVLSTRLRLERFLPFIAISAASAPLLGLLGTVTGIISTFKLITVHGAGDVKVLSGGISEALITTEFGLIVAIPSLLIHAFLSRKARRAIDCMEKAAVALVNQIGKARHRRDAAPSHGRNGSPEARRAEHPKGAKTIARPVSDRDALLAASKSRSAPAKPREKVGA